MNCEEWQGELAVAILTRTSPGLETASHIADCPTCSKAAAELAPLPMLLAAAPAPADLAADRALLSMLRAAAAARRRRRTRLLVAAAAAILAMIAGIVIGLPRSGGPAMAGATVVGGISAAVTVAPTSVGASIAVTVAGLAPGSDCQVSAITTRGAVINVVRWTVGYYGTGHVTGTTSIATSDLTRIDLTEPTSGSLIASIQLRRA